MDNRRAEAAPERRWRVRWIVALVVLAVGIWALYTFWYSPGMSRRARHTTPPAAETSY